MLKINHYYRATFRYRNGYMIIKCLQNNYPHKGHSYFRVLYQKQDGFYIDYVNSYLYGDDKGLNNFFKEIKEISESDVILEMI